jgi:transposase
MCYTLRKTTPGVYMRGRKAAEIENINDYDFDVLAKTCGTPRERIRYIAFAHIQEGKSFTEVASMIRVKLRTLMNWIKNFKKDQIEGLKEKTGRGADPYLEPEHHEAFRQAVLELQHNRKGGRVKGRDILEMMKSKFGIEPSLSTVYDTLKRVNLVWITGRSKHSKADFEAQESFKKTLEKTC